MTTAPWGWNGSLERPTFTPSVRAWRPNDTYCCHSYVTDGRIQFLDDCTHELAGKLVDLPEWPFGDD